MRSGSVCGQRFGIASLLFRLSLIIRIYGECGLLFGSGLPLRESHKQIVKTCADLKSDVA